MAYLNRVFDVRLKAHLKAMGAVLIEGPKWCGKTTLMMVIHMREVDAVTTAIKGIDPSAFVIVTDAYDAYGKRWKAFPDRRSIELS